MQNRSLVRQVVAIVLAAQLVCAAILSGLALHHERVSRFRAFDVQLQGRSDSLLGAIQDAEDPADNVYIDPRELKLPPEDVYVVYNQDGRFLGSSPNVPDGLLAKRGDGFHDVLTTYGSYRLYQRRGLRIIDRAESGGVGLNRPVTILYAAPTEHLWHEIVEAASYYLIAIGIAALFTGLLVVVLVRRAMRPLNELATAACEISVPTLAFEAPPSVMEVRELRPLAEVLTSVVSGLREAFAREQQFIGDAAHELKTAVAVVRSSVQLLMMKMRTPEEYAAGLERVLEDNRRVETLVAQMLQLARVEGPSLENIAPLDFGATVSSAVMRMESLAQVNGVSLRSDIVQGKLVRLQSERASALVTNLIHNAIQHSNAGTQVKVLVAERNGHLVMEVADSGTGIQSDALPHVFDRFFREDQSRSRDTGGAGLGLAICKSIVDAAGGTIEIVSEQGKGTTVTTTFIQV